MAAAHAAAVPYYSLPAGVAFLIASLLVCASNCSRVWLVRTMGETEYHGLIIRVASRVPVGLGILYSVLSPLCMFAIGGITLMFYPSLNRDWAAWFAYAFFIYGSIMATYGSLAFLRYRREGIALES